MVNNLSVGQELDKLANLLDSYNEKIAVDRLRSLGASINETSFLATWTAADIQRVIDPDGIVAAGVVALADAERETSIVIFPVPRIA